MEKSTRLRTMLKSAFASSQAITVVGAHNGLTAVIAEQAGFDAVWASSFEISATRGLPDASLLSLADYLQVAVHIDRATSLPVIADCDTGFGNTLNVAYMVREYEAAGIAAVCIEDKRFPKVNSFAEHKQKLISADEFSWRISVAKRVQRSPDFMLIARTEAYIAGYGTDEAIGRARAYVDAGADAVLVHSRKPDPEDIKDFLRQWQGRHPVVIVPTTYYEWSVGEAARAGVSMCIYANQGLRAAVSAVRRTLNSIHAEGTSSKIEDEIATVDEVFALQQLKEWLALER